MIHRNQRLTQKQQKDFQKICRDLGFAHLLDLSLKSEWGGQIFVGGNLWKCCFNWYHTIWQDKPFRIDKGFVKNDYGILEEKPKISKSRGNQYNFHSLDTVSRAEAAKVLLTLTKAQKESGAAALYEVQDSPKHIERKATMLDGDLLAAMREAALQHFLIVTDGMYFDDEADDDEKTDFNDLEVLQAICDDEIWRAEHTMSVTNHIANRLNFIIKRLREYGVFEPRDDGKPWPKNNNENALLCRWLQLVGALQYGEIEDVKSLENEQNRLIRYILTRKN